jgi:hypothetical protein
MIKMRLMSLAGASPNVLFRPTTVEERMSRCRARKVLDGQVSRILIRVSGGEASVIEIISEPNDEECK